MYKIITTIFLSILTMLSVNAQTTSEIYSTASKEVRTRIDQNQKKGKKPLDGIIAKYTFKISIPIDINISDLDVHLIEAPGRISNAMNLSNDWDKIKSVELLCYATITLEDLKTYFLKKNIIINKSKVIYYVKNNYRE